MLQNMPLWGSLLLHLSEEQCFLLLRTWEQGEEQEQEEAEEQGEEQGEPGRGGVLPTTRSIRCSL